MAVKRLGVFHIAGPDRHRAKVESDRPANRLRVIDRKTPRQTFFRYDHGVVGPADDPEDTRANAHRRRNIVDRIGIELFWDTQRRRESAARSLSARSAVRRCRGGHAQACDDAGSGCAAREDRSQRLSKLSREVHLVPIISPITRDTIEHPQNGEFLRLARDLAREGECMLQAGHNFVGWSAVEVLGKREGGFDRQLVSQRDDPVLLQVQERGFKILPMLDKARSYHPERKRLGNQFDTRGWIPTVDQRPVKAGSRVFQIADTTGEPAETCVILSN